VADTAEGNAPRAVKIVPPEEGARLRWEFELLAGIAHPSVASVHELLRVSEPVAEPFGLSVGEMALVEQYVPGEGADRAADALRSDLGARLSFVVRTGAALARGLSAIHAAGMIHGDVKPSNVIVDGDGEGVVLIDLGLARPPGFSSHVGGTPGYMAPEAWQGERTVATDLYALGATLHRLLTGRALGGTDDGRPISEIVTHALSRWRARPQLPEGTPSGLAHLIESLLSPEPLERPASARDVVGRLHAVAAEIGEPMGVDADVASAGAADAATPAERAMTMRALPWVGDPEQLVRLTAALAAGGVVSVVGPHGSGRSRLITESIRSLQEQCADAERSVPTAIRTDASLPNAPIRHHAVLHVEAADTVGVREARGLARAAELEGGRLTVVLERRQPAEGADEEVSLGPLSDLQIGQILACAVRVSDPSTQLIAAARAASGALAGRLCRLLAAAMLDGRDPARASCYADLGGVAGAAAELTIPAAARGVAELVAVAGGQLDPDDAVGALGGSGRFDLLVADGLATLTDQGRLQLRGDLVPLLRGSMSSKRRRSLAAALDDATLGAEARAYVASAAGAVEHAAEGFLAAIRHRRRMGDPEGAVRLASDALLELAGQCSEERSLHLRLELADALRARGRYAEARVALEGQGAAEACVLRAEVGRLGGDGDGPRGEVEAVLAGASAGPAVQARARALLARLCLDRGALDEALAHAEQARELATEEGLDAEAARAIEVAALVHLQRGELEVTGRLAAEAVARARRAGDRVADARARSIAAAVALRTGRVHAAARGQVDAFELAEAAGEAHAAATFLVNVGLARLDAGEPGPAIVALREGARRLARLGRDRDLARTLYNLANAAALVGDDDVAGPAVGRALKVARDCGDVVAESWARVVEVELALRAGRLDVVEEALRGAEDRLASLPDPASRVVVAARCAVAWLVLEQEVAAAEALEVARPEVVETPDDAAARVEWHVAEVRAALHGGDNQGAREHAMAGWASAEQSGVFEMRLRAGLALADASGALGDGEARTQALSEVRSLLDAATHTLEPNIRARMRAVPAYRAAFVSPPDGSGHRGASEGRWRQLAVHAKRLMSEPRVGRLYEEVLEAAMELAGADRGFIVTRSPEGALHVRVARGIGRRHLREDAHDVSRSIVGRVLDGGQPMATLDALADETLRGSASIHALDLRSVLAVPFQVSGEVAAAIYLDDRLRPGAFGPEALELVSDLAELASAAIQSADRMRAERRTARRLAVAQRQLERQVETQAMEIAALRRAPGRMPLEGSGIIAHGAAMRRVLELTEKVAAAQVPALITGESGTGKELVARALHAHGPRHGAPFVTENCGAIPEALLESALFGHVRGAFTGADRHRVGLFEAADGGVLFLDEIGEMSPAMQAKLLRVVQDGQVRPVGGERTRKVDVRIVAATHRDLSAMVRDGQFREDLYYRLAVVTLPLPPCESVPRTLRRSSPTSSPSTVRTSGSTGGRSHGCRDTHGRATSVSSKTKFNAQCSWPTT
jgi:serine/threonine-protein kinase PknK